MGAAINSCKTLFVTQISIGLFAWPFEPRLEQTTGITHDSMNIGQNWTNLILVRTRWCKFGNRLVLHLEIGCIILKAEKILKTWPLPYMWCGGKVLQTLGLELKESFNRCILVGRRGVSQWYKTIAPYFKGCVSGAHRDLERQLFSTFSDDCVSPQQSHCHHL